MAKIALEASIIIYLKMAPNLMFYLMWLNSCKCALNVPILSI